jgi:cell wall-associated NlpC family hydrolase
LIVRVLVPIAIVCAFLAPIFGATVKPKAKRPTRHVAVKAKTVKSKAKAKAKVRKVSAKRKRTSIRSRRIQAIQKPPSVTSPAPAPCLTCSGNLMEVAHSFTGLRYRRGGSTPETGFDCSGFVKYVYQTAQDLLLPRSASQQFTQGSEVAKDELVQGDLVFFRRGRSHWHVGIYNGDGNFIHSPNSRESVKLTSLDTPYYKRHYIGARRVSSNLPIIAANLQVPVLPPPPEYVEAENSDQR